MSRLLYFAYGSNLCLSRLRRRVPSCQVLVRASLAGHQLRFHKRGRDGSAKCDAFLTHDPADAVQGVVYSMLQQERPALDRAEDLGRGYDAHWLAVESSQGELRVLTYRARPEMIDTSLQPFDWYLAFVCGGARQHGLDADYLERLAQVPGRSDPDSHRNALNWAILHEADAGVPPESW